MYKVWQYLKPLIRPLFGSAASFSLTKEKILLVIGFCRLEPLAYRHQLPILLNFLHLQGKGVEVGVRDGAYSEVLLTYSQLDKLYSVDPWRSYDEATYRDASNVSQQAQDQLHAFTVKRLQKFMERAIILRTTSQEAQGQFANTTLDFVYIDANHSYEACKQDLELWWPKLRTGGVLAGHDYLDGELPQGSFGVKRAVGEFAKIHGQKIYQTPEKWPTWYLIKNGRISQYLKFYHYLSQAIKKQYHNQTFWRLTRGLKNA